MQIKHVVTVFDAPDLAAESSFWSGLLGGVVEAEDDWHMVMVEGEPRIGVQPDAFEVYADPAGHPFCFCWVRDPATPTASQQ